jgi:malate dehydrogenase (oxaloacetate-decarboxylating)
MKSKKINYQKESLKLHKALVGKLEITLKTKIKNKHDLSTVYSPGVAGPCLAIEKDEKKYAQLVSAGITIAVISDGSAVLGLGNLGAKPSMPVIEGKSVLFKRFADINSIPIVLDTQDTEEIIQTIKNIAPSFGGINLEDISAPRCFEIEERLKKELDIPVFHDDQHGTAIVVLA